MLSVRVTRHLLRVHRGTAILASPYHALTAANPTNLSGCDGQRDGFLLEQLGVAEDRRGLGSCLQVLGSSQRMCQSRLSSCSGFDDE